MNRNDKAKLNEIVRHIFCNEAEVVLNENETELLGDILLPRIFVIAERMLINFNRTKLILTRRKKKQARLVFDYVWFDTDRDKMVVSFHTK